MEKTCGSIKEYFKVVTVSRTALWPADTNTYSEKGEEENNRSSIIKVWTKLHSSELPQ